MDKYGNYTAEGIIKAVRALPEGRAIAFTDFGNSKTLTVDIRHYHPTFYVVRVIKQNAVFDKFSRRYRDKVLHTYHKVPSEMLPYVMGRIVSYDICNGID